MGYYTQPTFRLLQMQVGATWPSPGTITPVPRCPACGRRYTKTHDKRVGTPQAYQPNCQRYQEKQENTLI